ncbi:MAG: acyl carrier protein [Propionibacteriaceae bacterium]|jgi:acyl carrier protein|nr:acyl carrier protein [Propionibacteriaceae bacterium]
METPSEAAVAALGAGASGSPGPTADLASVTAALETCLAEVIGADTVALLQIKAETRLLQDLGLSSIELVQLLEAVQRYYGPQTAAFLDHIQTLPLSKIARLTVGDFVGFIIHAPV